MKSLLLRSTALALLLACRAEASGRVSLIYGGDNRSEPYAATPLERAMAHSTVALFDDGAVVPDTTLVGLLHLRTRPYTTVVIRHNRFLSEEGNLCRSERFYGQPVGPFCTGFLVGPDLLATAGHCVMVYPSADEFCKRVAFVFDYGYYEKGEDPTLTDRSRIDSCARVVAYEYNKYMIGQPDWALVRLSRPVDPGRRPAFEIDRGPMPKVGTPLLMIGHPMGLPVKIADGARVTSQGKGFFYADLDAYRGNSGSPVLSRDGVVEGIMVSYPQANMNDFVVSLGQDNSTICMKSTVIPDAGRSGMIVFPIRYLASKIPELRRAARRFQPDERGLRLLGSLTDMP